MSAARARKRRAAPAKAPVSGFRRSMIAKINIAWKQLCMDEADYRTGLAEIAGPSSIDKRTGQASLTKCSDAQLGRVLEWLVSKGFRPVQGQSKSTAVHPMARKARALWISLHHLGAIDNPSERALEAFATRQLKCERLVWANQRDAFRLIEALKAWGVRAGWPEAGISNAVPIVQQASLCQAILAKLKDVGLAQPGWDLKGAAMRLGCSLPVDGGAMSVDAYRTLAAELGGLLRAARDAVEPAFRED